MANNEDPWHFSYLGKEFFQRIANNLRATNIKDAQIEDLYLGCTGIPYVEKLNLRPVNPNWCVRLKDGKEFKYGKPIGNSLKPGLWNTENCIYFKWSDIVSFYS